MDRKAFVDGFVESVKALKNGENGTYYWWLDIDNEDGLDWAIVLGWGEGWDDPNDSCCNGHYRIMSKVAYQEHNCIMQCDYDIDWTMPYDEETGEVDDSDFAIYEDYDDDKLREIANELLKLADTYK